VQDLVNGYADVQRGLINKEKFYIPQNKVESYDGAIHRFLISESELRAYPKIIFLYMIIQHDNCTNPR
jgi:hypothetical protein